MSNKRCKNEEYGPVVINELTPSRKNNTKGALFNGLDLLARNHQLRFDKLYPKKHTDINAMD
jgi:hypothetical protein